MVQAGRLIGGILLISGTTIGAGILALPISTSQSGFLPSTCLLVLCWLFMLASAFFFLDVNLAVKGEPNLISMAARTLGGWGKTISWVFYLLLLYSLTAAYISGSAPIFVEAIYSLTGIAVPLSLAHFFLPVLFGGFIYLGTTGVDYINRILMMGLIVSYFVLIGLIPCGHANDLMKANWPILYSGMTVVVTAFGYHIIIPSLTTYMNHDAKKMRIAIIVGSAIPLVVYLIWNYLIYCAVPEKEMLFALQKGEAATAPLSRVLSSPFLGMVAQFFAFFVIVTSFLGVTLSLSDFLADGFKIKKNSKGRLLACALTFIPPLVFVFTYQRGFYMALEYGGAFVGVLLIFLPAMMAWKLRPRKFYKTVLGKTVLALVLLFALFVFSLDFLEKLGAIPSLF